MLHSLNDMPSKNDTKSPSKADIKPPSDTEINPLDDLLSSPIEKSFSDTQFIALEPEKLPVTKK